LKTKDNAALTLAGDSAQDQAAGVLCTRSTVQPMVDQFNAFSATLTIGGKNEFRAEAILVEPQANANDYRRKDGV
jgi:hypothetical protein